MNDSPHMGPIAIIADDEELGRLLLAESAIAAGLTPLVFDDGPAALDAALSQEVAIILLDVDMPGMDGYSVCRTLRATQRLETVPIIMVTGHEDPAAIGHAFEAGATDFISKPVNWALLPRRLEYILRNAAATRALAERVSQVNTLVGAIPDTLWVVAPDGVIRWDPKAAPVERLAEVTGSVGGSDAALRTVAGRLTRALEGFSGECKHLSVARFGGDEFVILVRDPAARAISIEIADCCCATFKQPVEYEGLEFHSGTSIGLAVYPDDGDALTTVLKHADTAMYQAKAGANGAVAVYTPAMSSRLRNWLDL
ncbi:MAG TPA: response regulator, partial [Steroidobacteraceae bacterium]